jgi:hypothetical protein
MIPDAKGLNVLVIAGAIALTLLYFLLPIGIAYGLAWLLEPRFNPAYSVAFWFSVTWASCHFLFPLVWVGIKLVKGD